MSDYNATVNVSTSSKLNVRKGPGTTHAIIGARYRGDTVRVTHHDGQWRKIAWSAGQIAYVHGNYLQNVDSDTESDPTGDPRLNAGNPELTTEPSPVPLNSSASISALSDSELKERIDNWSGTDNDPILDRLVSERNARLDVSTQTSGKPSCENPRQCDGAAGDLGVDRRGSAQLPFTRTTGNEDRCKSCTFIERSQAAFEAIPPERQDKLFEIRDDLVKTHGEHTTNPTLHQLPFYVLNHNEVGDLLIDLAANNDLTNDEKAYVWSHFSYNTRSEDQRYVLTAGGADPLVVNDDSRGSDNTSNHTIVSFTDDYHGGLVDLSLEDAESAIVSKESSYESRIVALLVWNGDLNEGDVNASYRQIQALKVFNETGDFSAFAEEWKHQFLDNGNTDRYAYDENPTPSTSSSDNSGHIPAPASQGQSVPAESVFDNNPNVDNAGVPRPRP